VNKRNEAIGGRFRWKRPPYFNEMFPLMYMFPRIAGEHMPHRNKKRSQRDRFLFRQKSAEKQKMVISTQNPHCHLTIKIAICLENP